MTEPSLTAGQVAAVQTELRAVLSLPPEAFPIATFISMVSDEIEQMRQKGFTDEDIAVLIRASSQIAVFADDVRRHYAPPEARSRQGPERLYAPPALLAAKAMALAT